MSNREIVYLPPNALTASEQVRKHFDDNSLTGLAISLRTRGMRQPIRARRVGGKPIIILGERRWRAALKAGLAEVPVIIEEEPQSEAAIICDQLVENLQRADLLPYEKAQALHRLMSVTGWNATQTSRTIGISGATITKLLTLLTLPEPIKAELAQGRIALSTAYELAKVGDAATQINLANDAAAGRVTREAVNAAAKKRINRKKPPEKRPTFRGKLPLPEGGNISITGPKIPLTSLVFCLEALLAEARVAQQRGIEVVEFFEARQSRKPGQAN